MGGAMIVFDKLETLFSALASDLTSEVAAIRDRFDTLED
jgi:hypothetical protein